MIFQYLLLISALFCAMPQSLLSSQAKQSGLSISVKKIITCSAVLLTLFAQSTLAEESNKTMVLFPQLDTQSYLQACYRSDNLNNQNHFLPKKN